jgi:hypothetical protein
MIPRIVGLLVGLIGATWLFWAGIAFERRPVGQFSFSIPIWGPLHVGWNDPGGPAAQLAVLKAEEARAAQRAMQVVARQADVSAAADVAETRAQTRIRLIYRTLHDQIPTIIPAPVDRHFALSVGFVRVHDAAVWGVDLSDAPLAAGQSDGAASEIAQSRAASVIADNYGSCRADQERLSALQDWIRKEAAVQP